MALNFKILVRQKKSRLYLKLDGDFDRSSALELLGVLRDNIEGIDRVFIDTNDLGGVCAQGRILFHSRLLHALDNRSVGFVLTGENAFRIAPEESKVL